MSDISVWGNVLSVLHNCPPLVIDRKEPAKYRRAKQEQKVSKTNVKYVYKCQRGEKTYFIAMGVVDGKSKSLYFGKNFVEAINVRRKWEIDTGYHERVSGHRANKASL